MSGLLKHQSYRRARRRSIAIAAAAFGAGATALSIADFARASDVHWIAPGGGEWTTASNWSTSPIYPKNGSPTAADTYSVALDPLATGTAYSVNLDTAVSGDVTLDSLSLNAPVTLSVRLGTLQANNGVALNAGKLRLNGATLKDTTVTSTGGVLAVGNFGNLDNVTLDSDMTFAADFTGGAYVYRDLNCQGHTISMLASLTFQLGATLSGGGELVFDKYSVGVGASTSRDELTIPSNFTIRSGAYGGSVSRVVNHGTIRSQTAGQTVTVSGQYHLVNDGVLAATNGGTLTLTALQNSGLVTADAGSTINFNTSLTNTGTIRLNGATANISGYLGIASLGDFQRVGGDSGGGAVNLGGTMTLNANETFVLNASTGSWNLTDGGSFSGGHLATGDGAKLFVVGDASIGSIVDGNVSVEPGAFLSGPALAVNGTVSLHGNSTSGASLSLASLDGAGNVVFDGTGTKDAINQYGPTALTIAAAAHIVTGAGGGVIAGSVTNNGTISATTAGKIITFTGTSLVNNGTIEAINGGTIALNWPFTSSGVVRVTGPSSTIRIGGSAVSLAAIDLLTLADNANVAITGTVSNAGSSMVAGGANYRLCVSDSGKIDGGTINAYPGRALTVIPPASGAPVATLSNLTLAAPLEVLAGASVTLSNVSNTGTITSSGNTTFSGTTSNAGSVSVPSGNFVLSGTWSNNAGSINVSGSGVLRMAAAPPAAGLGSISASGGTIVLQTPMTTALFKTMSRSNTAVVLSGAGALQNAGDSIQIDGSAGSIILFGGGKISGGRVVVANSSGSTPTQSGTLDGVTLAGKLSVAAGSTLSISTAGITLDDGQISLPGGALSLGGSVSGAGEIVLDGNGASVRSSGTAPYTICPGITVRGGASGGFVGSGIATLTNQGTIASRSNKTPISLSGSNYVNQGTLEASGGGKLTVSGTLVNNGGSITVAAGSSFVTTAALTMNAGSIGGDGSVTIQSAATINDDVTKPGGGSMRVTGAFTLATGKRLDLSNGKLILSSVGVGTWGGVAYGGASGLIASGHNDGAWDGAGLVTSQTDATTGTLTSLGVATASQVIGIDAAATANWAGQMVAGSDTLVMYTYGGDANLDGQITGDDYFQIDSAYPTPGANGWLNGDFNYDGAITGDDYFVIDSNFPAQGAPFPTSDGVSMLAAVPEPSSISCVVAVTLAAACRRRRRM